MSYYKKLNPNGFSAIELVVAVVAVVVIAALGFYAFNSRSNNDASTSTATQEPADSEQSEAEATKASADNWATTPQISVDGMKIGASLCKNGDKLKVFYMKTGNKKLQLDDVPGIFYMEKNLKMGTFTGGRKWWAGSMQLWNYKYKASDWKETGGIAVKYKSTVGKTLPWSSVKAC